MSCPPCSPGFLRRVPDFLEAVDVSGQTESTGQPLSPEAAAEQHSRYLEALRQAGYGSVSSSAGVETLADAPFAPRESR
jgi:hypothetical protein